MEIYFSFASQYSMSFDSKLGLYSKSIFLKSAKIYSSGLATVTVLQDGLMLPSSFTSSEVITVSFV
jgi:hypothetical protein